MAPVLAQAGHGWGAHGLPLPAVTAHRPAAGGPERPGCVGSRGPAGRGQLSRSGWPPASVGLTSPSVSGPAPGRKSLSGPLFITWGRGRSWQGWDPLDLCHRSPSSPAAAPGSWVSCSKGRGPLQCRAPWGRDSRQLNSPAAPAGSPGTWLPTSLEQQLSRWWLLAASRQPFGKKLSSPWCTRDSSGSAGPADPDTPRVWGAARVHYPPTPGWAGQVQLQLSGLYTACPAPQPVLRAYPTPLPDPCHCPALPPAPCYSFRAALDTATCAPASLCPLIPSSPDLTVPLTHTDAERPWPPLGRAEKGRDRLGMHCPSSQRPPQDRLWSDHPSIPLCSGHSSPCRAAGPSASAPLDVKTTLPTSSSCGHPGSSSSQGQGSVRCSQGFQPLIRSRCFNLQLADVCCGACAFYLLPSSSVQF